MVAPNHAARFDPEQNEIAVGLRKLEVVSYVVDYKLLKSRNLNDLGGEKTGLPGEGFAIPPGAQNSPLAKPRYGGFSQRDRPSSRS